MLGPERDPCYSLGPRAARDDMAKLTARFVEAVRADEGERLEFSDDDFRGLALRVTGRGTKTWALRYRLPSGERRKLTLGTFPPLSLADARDRARIALGQVADKRDPAAVQKAEKRDARHDRLTKPSTLAALWETYKRLHLPKQRESTQDYNIWLWDKHLKDRVGDLRLKEVDRATVKLELRAIGAAAPSTANKGLALLRHMLSFAVEHEFLTASPLAGQGALFDETSRDRVLNDDELRVLWRGLLEAPAQSKLPVSDKTCSALKLVLLTAARAREVAGIHVGEIDREARSWTIPAERSKSGVEHVVPLSPEAWGVLAAAFGDSDPDTWTGYAFPNRRDRDQHLERHSLTRAMSRIVEAEAFKIAERATVHDLRRTVATYLASERIGVAPHVVSAVLGHQQTEGARITATYNRHRYDREKRTALEAWAVLLLEIVNKKPRSENVVGLRERARRR